MTAPLTPPDCNLQDFPRMMIDIPRLRGSSFDATLDDGAWRAGLNLWMAAWHQVPAASLQDDDAELAKAAGLGRDIRTWKKVKDTALRGWRKCDDGLLYHPVVAEIALESWLEKLAMALSSGAGNAKRWGTAFDPSVIEGDIERTAGMLAALNPKSKALVKLARRKSRPPSQEDGDGSPGGKPKPSRRDHQNVPTGSQGTGTGKGIGEGSDDPSLTAGEPARTRPSKRQPEEPIPDGFPGAPDQSLAEGWVAAAQVELNIGNQAKRFRNHAETKDRRERNWAAAWRAWIEISIEDAPLAKAKDGEAPLPVWNGPADVMAIAEAAMTGAKARSYLSRCTWQEVPFRAVVAPNGFVAEQIIADAGKGLAAEGVQVLARDQVRAA